MFDKIIAFSIGNKATIGAMTLALVVWGAWSATRLPIDAVPDITNNQVQVITQAPSLGAQEVEQFITAPIELAIEDLHPGAEVEAAFRHGDDFAAHDLAFHVGVGVVFAGAVVGVALGRFVERGQLLQPLFVIGVQARLIVVDEDRSCDVHGVDQAQALLDAAFADDGLDGWRDVLKRHSLGKTKRQILGVGFHEPPPQREGNDLDRRSQYRG